MEDLKSAVFILGLMLGVGVILSVFYPLCYFIFTTLTKILS